MKQYEKYKHSEIEWIGEIPAHWDKSRLKWVCRFEYGESLSTNDREEGDFPVYGSNGITGYHSVAISKAPCIIVGRKGSFGKVNYSEKECFPIDTTYYIDSRQTSANLRWLFYGLQQLGLDTFSRDTGVPGLNREDAYQNILPLPSPTEQTAIAAYLDEKTARIDKLIANKQRLIELLKEERTAIINHAVSKGINPKAKLKPSGIKWLGDIPEHWEVKKLKYVISKVGSGITPTGGASVYQQEGVPLLRSQNVYSSGLILDDVAYISEEIDEAMSNSRIKEGDVLLNITGASIGRCYFVPDDFGRGNVNQHVCIIRPVQSVIKTKYLHFVIISGYGQTLIDACQTGANREGLNFQQIKAFDIPLPKIDEQENIISYIETSTHKIDATISKIEKEIELVQEYRTALISEVVTGKIKVI